VLADGQYKKLERGEPKQVKANRLAKVCGTVAQSLTEQEFMEATGIVNPPLASIQLYTDHNTVKGAIGS